MKQYNTLLDVYTLLGLFILPFRFYLVSIVLLYSFEFYLKKRVFKVDSIKV